MPEDKSTAEIPDHFKVRRCIMLMLYDIFKEYPYAVVELRQIEENCRTSTKEVNWNLVYLEKCGYVELGKAIESPPYIASTATLTSEGIDLIENEIDFNRRFPRE
jgi:hypothetical protein